MIEYKKQRQEKGIKKKNEKKAVEESE